MTNFAKLHIIEIKSSLFSRYYAEACNEWRGHLRDLALGDTEPQKRRDRGSRERQCVDLTSKGIVTKTSRTDSVCLVAELIGRSLQIRDSSFFAKLLVKRNCKCKN